MTWVASLSTLGPLELQFGLARCLLVLAAAFRTVKWVEPVHGQLKFRLCLSCLSSNKDEDQAMLSDALSSQKARS